MPYAETITSTKNKRIKDVYALRDHRQRQKTGCTLIEGTKEITLALNAGVQLKEVFLCPDYLKTAPRKSLEKKIRCLSIPTTIVSKNVFQKMAFGDRHEGLLAIAQTPERHLKDFELKKNPLIVVLEDIEKPGNLGAVLRTCDAVGVDAVLACRCPTDLYNPNIIRASLGSVFSVPVAACSNRDALDFLKKNRIKIYAAAIDASNLYDRVSYAGSAIVLGSEQKGLSVFWMKACDQVVTIPMRGRVNSLNIAISASVLIYEADRQQRQ